MKVKDRSLLGVRELNLFCERKGIPVRAFFTTAFALALKSYTAADEAVFTCRDQGKKAVLRLACDPKETILSEIKRCEDLLFEAFENDKTVMRIIPSRAAFSVQYALILAAMLTT